MKEEDNFYVFSFITPSESKKISYQTHKQNLINALQRKSWFERGELLDSLEKGVIYPVVHRLHVKGTTSLMESTVLGPDFNVQQGIYLEIRKFTPPSGIPPEKMNGGKAYIFLAFMSLDTTFSDVLEDNWKEWTGARLIYLNLSSEFGINKVSFYRRVSPEDNINMFMYILIVECSNVNKESVFQLLQFIQMIRVERVFGYLSAYRLETSLISSSLINGMLTDPELATKVDI